MDLFEVFEGLETLFKVSCAVLSAYWCCSVWRHGTHPLLSKHLVWLCFSNSLLLVIRSFPYKCMLNTWTIWSHSKIKPLKCSRPILPILGSHGFRRTNCNCFALLLFGSGSMNECISSISLCLKLCCMLISQSPLKVAYSSAEFIRIYSYWENILLIIFLL